MKKWSCSDFECDSLCTSCTSNHNPLFRGLNVSDRELFDSDRSKIFYKRGEVIFKEGLFPYGLICLNKGKVMVTKSDDFGNSVIINLHKEVTFLGIADYIAQKPYQSNAIALEDSTVCILKHEVVQDFMVKNKAFNSSLLGSLSAQFHQSNNRLLVATKKQMSSRLADGLLELKRVFGTTPSGHLNVYLKRAELAILCNMSIANIIRQLSSFDKNEIIKLEGKKILISNENLLLKESETA